jgi:hypothetical protein
MEQAAAAMLGELARYAEACARYDTVTARATTP